MASSSLFIEKSNQQLLWEMIHKYNENNNNNKPLIQRVFTQNNPNDSNQKKETWFRSILQEIHQRNPNIQSREQLMILNRSALAYLIQSLQQYIRQQQQPHTEYNFQEIPNTKPKSVSFQEPITQYSRNSGWDQRNPNRELASDKRNPNNYSASDQRNPNNREEMYNREFEERKRQYDFLLEKQPPPDVKFTEKEDTAISNMTELLEQQRKLRELDIQPITQPITQNQTQPITQNQTQPTIQNQTITQNKYNPGAPVLKIHHDEPEIEQIEIEQIEQIHDFNNNQHIQQQFMDFKQEFMDFKQEFMDFKQVVLQFISEFGPNKSEFISHNNDNMPDPKNNHTEEIETL
jgi:hypothetical protein